MTAAEAFRFLALTLGFSMMALFIWLALKNYRGL